MLLQDLRYAVRSLSRSPGFTLVAVACLALGIGVNSAIFSIVDGVLLQPYPYPEADRIVVLNSHNQQSGIRRALISWPDFEDYRDETTTFSSLAAFTGRSLTIADGTSDPERYSGAIVSWNLFSLLGTPPALGRDFGPEDDRPGAEPVVLLSDDVWQRRYGADRSIVGKAISINGRPHTVIGVMPPKFLFWENQRLWVPIGLYVNEMTRGDRSLQVMARLRPGATIDQARADLEGIAGRLAATYPLDNENWGSLVRPLREWMLPAQVEIMILAMMGAVTLVLLIACANVANLLLARASVRHREISIRSALGAGRWRIVRQLLTEAVVIGLVSAPLGIAIAWAGIQLIDRGIPPDSIPYFIHWALDARSLAYTIAISMATGIVFGLAPALQAARANLQESLKEGARGATGGRRARMRNALVVAEISMSLILLVGASLFVRSFLNLQNSAVGFDTAPLMTMRFYLPGEAYDADAAKARRVQDIVRRVEALPGVEAAFASNFVPLGGGGGGGSVLVEGRPFERGQEPGITLVAATPHLRRALGVSLVRGRDPTDSEEVTRTPVAVVNQTMAARLWPGQDPVGRRFRLTGERLPDWFTVIGVVADFRHFAGDSDRPVFPSAYVPYTFEPTLNTGLTIRATSNPAQVTSAVREQIRAADPSLPVFSTFTMEELRQRSFWQDRLFGWMFSVFGVIALLLASIGVYGVLSYSVSQRTQEIGVRMALGADRRDVLHLIVAYGLKLAGAGIAVGVLGAAAATQAIKSVLHNVTPTDPLSFGSVIVFLTFVAAAASYFPARRAMAVDPIIALRDQ
ncbi:MAG TPA: ABC transporter permease [Vicinamibacterales bacterium]|nr:ABC transporter permease [Vicinamibacterales bacterium]